MCSQNQVFSRSAYTKPTTAPLFRCGHRLSFGEYGTTCRSLDEVSEICRAISVPFFQLLTLLGGLLPLLRCTLANRIPMGSIRLQTGNILDANLLRRHSVPVISSSLRYFRPLLGLLASTYLPSRICSYRLCLLTGDLTRVGRLVFLDALRIQSGKVTKMIHSVCVNSIPTTARLASFKMHYVPAGIIIVVVQRFWFAVGEGN
jgi:hypothetical protein